MQGKPMSRNWTSTSLTFQTQGLLRAVVAVTEGDRGFPYLVLEEGFYNVHLICNHEELARIRNAITTYLDQ